MSEHTQTDDGLTDDNVDVSHGTQTQGSMAENEIFLEHFLGIRIPQHIHNIEHAADSIAEQVAYRIVSGVDQTRARIAHNDLRDALDQRITDALENVQVQAHAGHHPGHHRDEHLNTLKAVADAIRETIPEDLIDELVRNEMTVGLDVQPGVAKHIIQMKVKIAPSKKSKSGVVPGERTIHIDTRNSFWRENSFRSPQLLMEALKGRTIGEVGINVSDGSDVPPTYTLSYADAQNIVDFKVNAITPNNKYTALDESLLNGANRLNYYVNIRALVSASLSDVPGLAERKYVGNLNRADLTNYFLHNPNGHFAFWNRWVHGLPEDPNTLIYPVGGPGVTAVSYVVNRIFDSVGAGANAADLLATRETNMFQLQKEMRQQHELDSRLREGSDNKVGAAMASVIASQYPDVRPIIAAGRTEAQVQTDLDRARDNQILARQLAYLESVPLPSGQATFENLRDKSASIVREVAALGSYNYGHTVTIGTGAFAESMDVPSKYNASLRADEADRAPVRAWLNAKATEVRKEIEVYEEIVRRLRVVAQTYVRMGVTNGDIFTYIDSGTFLPDYTQYDARIDVVQIANQIRTTREITGKTPEDLGKDIEKFDKELKDVKAGKNAGPHGDVAQHLIIKEYLKRYRGLTESDATKATNYMRSRSKVDGDLTSAAEEVTASLFGHERENSISEYFENVPKSLWLDRRSPERRSRRIIYQIAYASHVPMKPNNYSRNVLASRYRNPAPEPNWSKAKYRSLIEAYYAMKKLYDGNGPARIKLQQTEYVQEQMKEISRALIKKHSESLLKDFGPSLGITDEKKAEILKEPTKQEHIDLIEQTLRSEMPEKYKHHVDHAIHFADYHTDWVRHTFLTNDKYGMLYGKKNKISARNVLYGNKYASIAGLGYRTPVAAGKYVGKTAMNAADGLWRRKWSIAAGAAIGTLFLPGLGTAAGAWIAGSRAKVAGGGHTVHADAHGDGHGGDGHGDGHGGDGHGDGHGDSHGH